MFDLLLPVASVANPLKRTYWRQGSGTTICEVHIKKGPEFGIAIVPLSDLEMRQRVSDFCNVTWAGISEPANDPGEEVARVSKEMDRALRNMSDLNRRTETHDGKKTTVDPAADLARSCESEENSERAFSNACSCKSGPVASCGMTARRAKTRWNG